MRRDDREPRFGFWRRTFAMLAKEFIQLQARPHHLRDDRR
jgi:hypothetical protein